MSGEPRHDPHACGDGIYGADLARIHHDHFGMVAEAATTELLSRLAGRPGGSIVSLAAGSGVGADRLLAAGYALYGVDTSAAMLAIACAHAPRARFERASIWDVAIPACVAVLAVGEAFGYAAEGESPAPARLRRRFETIAAALPEGGVMLFDLAGPGRSGGTGQRQRVWTHEGLLVALDEVEDPDARRLRRTVHTFVPVGDLHRGVTERHHLVLYDPDEVQDALEATGFLVERLAGYDSFRFLPGWHGFAATRAR